MKRSGHYCRVCGQYKANERFSGKGHARHLCRDCSRGRGARVGPPTEASAPASGNGPNWQRSVLDASACPTRRVTAFGSTSVTQNCPPVGVAANCSELAVPPSVCSAAGPEQSSIWARTDASTDSRLSPSTSSQRNGLASRTAATYVASARTCGQPRGSLQVQWSGTASPR